MKVAGEGDDDTTAANRERWCGAQKEDPVRLRTFKGERCSAAENVAEESVVRRCRCYCATIVSASPKRDSLVLALSLESSYCAFAEHTASQARDPHATR